MAQLAAHVTVAAIGALTSSLAPSRGRTACEEGEVQKSTIDVSEATHVWVVIHDGARVVLLTQRLDTGLPEPSHTVPHMRLTAAIGGRHAARHAVQLLLGPLREAKDEGLRRAVREVRLIGAARKTEQNRNRGRISTTAVVYEVRLAGSLETPVLQTALRTAFDNRAAPPTTLWRHAEYTILEQASAAELPSEWDSSVIAAVMQKKEGILSPAQELLPEIPAQFRSSSIALDVNEAEIKTAVMALQGSPGPRI